MKWAWHEANDGTFWIVDREGFTVGEATTKEHAKRIVRMHNQEVTGK